MITASLKLLPAEISGGGTWSCYIDSLLRKSKIGDKEQIMELTNFKGKQNSITEALQLKIPEHAVISITGAGGKTTLLFTWARELAESGKRVAVTTSAHMRDPDSSECDRPGDAGDLYSGVSVIYEADDAQDACVMADKAMDEGLIAFVVSRDPEKPGKVKAPSETVLEHIREAADAILIEADGSRRMPLKWPAPWEPAVPEYTDITVCVAGLSAVGKRTEETVYRAEELPELMKRDIVDVNFMHKILSSRDGGRKGSRGEFRVFMNQVDDDIDRLAAAYRLQQFFSVLGIQCAWGSLMDKSDFADAGVKGKDIGSVSRNRNTDITEIAVILEAAGNSSRFGSNKLLYIMDDGRPMAACIMDAVCEAAEILRSTPGSNVTLKKVLVTQYEEVAGLAPDFKIVMNDRPDLGISRSMQLGIEAAGDADAFMFFVCDQPWLRPGTICRLIREYKKGTAGIVSLAWQGKMCNPKIFDSRYKDELMSLSGDTGGRQIIASHKDDLLLAEAESEDEVKDIDRL